MKVILSWSLVLLFLISATPILAADEQGGAAMKIEEIIAECEKKFPEGSNPDPEERDKLIDKCIDEKTAAQSSGGGSE
jgi:hypothetical protein